MEQNQENSLSATAGAEKSDTELVRTALADPDAFLHIINRYKQRLFNYVMRITAVDPEEAEDILQEVFIKAYINLNDFDQDLKFSSWIYRITHNEVISQHRKNQARPQGYKADLDDAAVQNLASDLNPARDMDAKLLKQRIQAVLDRLDKKYREILVLKYLEEKSYQEISDILERPMGTVASLLNRAKREFRNEVEKANIEE